MTSAAAVLKDLRARGVRIRREGDRLKLAPPEKVTPDLIERVRAVRGDLLKLVQSQTPLPPGDLPDRPLDSLHRLHSLPRAGAPNACPPARTSSAEILSSLPDEIRWRVAAML